MYDDYAVTFLRDNKEWEKIYKYIEETVYDYKNQKKALFENTARAMGDAPREIKIRHIQNCLKADPAYGKGVAKALGIPLSEVS